jgi:hypothetical protein
MNGNQKFDIGFSRALHFQRTDYVSDLSRSIKSAYFCLTNSVDDCSHKFIFFIDTIDTNAAEDFFISFFFLEPIDLRHIITLAPIQLCY